MRKQLENQLRELQNEVVKMGRMVEQQLQLVLKALETSDTTLAAEVVQTDAAVNAQRFLIEEKCVELIATQQPAARDLRAIVAVMNMIVDIERMGDQAKAIAKGITKAAEHPKGEPKGESKGAHWNEIKQMGELAGAMLNQVLTAYVEQNPGIVEIIAKQDRELHDLYSRLFSHVIENMAETKKQKRVIEAYGILRTAQELERVGERVTNIAERIKYIATGRLQEINAETDHHAP